MKKNDVDKDVIIKEYVKKKNDSLAKGLNAAFTVLICMVIVACSLIACFVGYSLIVGGVWYGIPILVIGLITNLIYSYTYVETFK